MLGLFAVLSSLCADASKENTKTKNGRMLRNVTVIPEEVRSFLMVGFSRMSLIKSF